MGEHYRSDGSPSGPETPHDGDFPAALVHGVTQDGEDDAGRHKGDEVSDHLQYSLEPDESLEEARECSRNRPCKSGRLALLVVLHVQHKAGGTLEVEEDGADVGGSLGIVAVHELDALYGNPYDLVGGCARGFKNTHNDIKVLVLGILLKGEPMVRMKLVTHLQSKLPCGEGTDEGFLGIIREETTAWLRLVSPARSPLVLFEHLGKCSHKTVPMIVVTNCDGISFTHAASGADKFILLP